MDGRFCEGIRASLEATRAALTQLSEEAEKLNEIDEMLGRALKQYNVQLEAALGTALHGHGLAVRARQTAHRCRGLDLGTLFDRAQEVALEGDQVEVRLRFTDKASIGDVADLRKWSGEWYTIIHGISACVNERPEDTKIVGASAGSIWLYLVASAKIAQLVAIIAFCAAEACNQYLT